MHLASSKKSCMQKRRTDRERVHSEVVFSLDADLLFLDKWRAVWHDYFNWLSRTRAFCATVESLSANGSIVTEKVSKPDCSIMKKRQKHGISNVVRFPPKCTYAKAFEPRTCLLNGLVQLQAVSRWLHPHDRPSWLGCSALTL